MIKYINDKNQFEEEIKKGRVLVDFFAVWCGPCKMLSPVLEELETLESFEDITIIKVDVDQAEDIASSFGIRSIPSLFYFKEGKLITKTLGYQNLNQLKTLVS